MTPGLIPIPSWTLSRGRSIQLDRPRCMAILNLTPDSFADGGTLTSPSLAAEHAARCVDEGADLLDLGGESTRPGASRVTVNEQIERVVPAVRAIRGSGIDTPISVDTTLTEVARAALDAGADAINDVSGATEDEGMLALAAESDAGLILMHRLAPPGRDSYSDHYDQEPVYASVVAHVRDHLSERLRAARDAGVDASRVVLDPGLGFGKGVEDNLRLIEGTPGLVSLGRPVLSALSRKSFVGRVGLGRDSTPDERLAPTLALSTLHLVRGARIFRVHDVAAHRAALDAAFSALEQGGGSESVR